MRPRVFALVAAATLVLAVLIAAWGRERAVADFASDCLNPTATYPDANGMPTDLNLDSTQVVLFTSGIFAGSVNSNLGTICVDRGAVFQPSSINGASRSFVRGTAVMPALAAGSGALLDNEGTVRFLAQPNTNGVATVINQAGATITVEAGLALGPDVTVTNDGTIDVLGTMNVNGSTITSSGSFTVAGALNLVGSFTNTGEASVGGVLTVNSGGTLQNACRLTAGGLINNQTTGNSGVVQLGSGELRNNGSATYSQTTSAFTGGTNFANDGRVDGSGQYLFAGSTSTQGTVAGASAAEPIVFFDGSPTGSQIFDVQSGVITNTVRQPVIAPDPASCNALPPTTTSTTTTTTTTTSTTTTTTTTTAPTTTAPSTSTTTTTSSTTTTSTSTTSSTTTSTTTTTSVPPATSPPTDPGSSTTSTSPPTPPPMTSSPSSSAAAQTTTPGGGLPPTGPGGARAPILVVLVCAFVGAIAVITARRAANPDR